MERQTCHLIIGSNLGDRTAQMQRAKALIKRDIGPIIKESQLYETQPWGYPDQPWFLNQVLEITTSESPENILAHLKQIEKEVGRTPAEKWHARHIDVDILFLGHLVINREGIIIPHPHLHERNFVLVPLMDLIPECVHPVLGKTIEELYLDCRDRGEVYIFNPDEQGRSV